ncbi:hypothetical protein ZIOFF_037502 [Zingiber officinale]|uniref:Uncharacterized protein n=1 Tax=Zingiber officinale TaxID=94328 RepID=A0A8J5L466_ZINOF|nr:hypothetical protein ZIOFF_037502 [Zingiber officinale]
MQRFDLELCVLIAQECAGQIKLHHLWNLFIGLWPKLYNHRHGFLDIKMRIWLRNFVTRCIAICPNLFVAIIEGTAGSGRLIIIASMILSFELSFVLVPLLKFSSSTTKMGHHKNSIYQLPEACDGLDWGHGLSCDGILRDLFDLLDVQEGQDGDLRLEVGGFDGAGRGKESETDADQKACAVDISSSVFDDRQIIRGGELCEAPCSRGDEGLFVPRMQSDIATGDVISLLGTCHTHWCSQGRRHLCGQQRGFASFVALLINIAVASVSGTLCATTDLSAEDSDRCSDLTLNSASFLLKMILSFKLPLALSLSSSAAAPPRWGPHKNSIYIIVVSWVLGLGVIGINFYRELCHLDNPHQLPEACDGLDWGRGLISWKTWGCFGQCLPYCNGLICIFRLHHIFCLKRTCLFLYTVSSVPFAPE